MEKFYLDKLHVGVESIRVTEPSMIGSSESGLAELIDYVFKMFRPNEQQLPGLKERMSKGLLVMRPFQTPHEIRMADSPCLDVWFGTRDITHSENMDKFVTTKTNYEEQGGEYFKEHPTSNYFFSTPTPIVVETLNELMKTE